MGAFTGLTIPILADTWWPIAPVAYAAAGLGALGGVFFATALRASRRFAERRPFGTLAAYPWLPPILLWVGAAFVITMMLSFAEGWHLDEAELWLGGLAGALAGAMTFPFGWWLLRRAVRAQRARRGSLVASADLRSLWSVASITLAAECAIALPTWTHVGRYYRGWPPTLVGHVTIAAAVTTGVVIALLDLRDLKRAEQLRNRRETLEELDGLDEASDGSCGGVDLGLGREVYGRVEIQGQYRGRTRRIPAVVGDPLLAARALGEALTRSIISALVLAGLGLFVLATT